MTFLTQAKYSNEPFGISLSGELHAYIVLTFSLGYPDLDYSTCLSLLFVTIAFLSVSLGRKNLANVLVILMINDRFTGGNK